ncbi:MAG: TRAP transporter substrate-binding protein [Synergistaceae bacterium]|jgi:C4-dicarboxylate-binding protein DctP|nr:TRAP transporter substrate-binding protein [Synergistaceae bacterium]
MKAKHLFSIILAGTAALGIFAIPAAAEAAAPIVIKFSHNQAIGTPEDVGAQALRARLEELAGDRVKVEVYPASQLGSLREQVESTQMGVIHLTLQPASVITPFVDDIKVIDFPYLLPADREKIFGVLDGELGAEGLEPLSRGGFKGMGYWFAGYKLFTTKKTPIHTPDDFKGLRIRVMDSPLLISQYGAWGATAVPIAYAEVYNALQQNVVDGQENPIQTIAQNNYQEVQGEIVQSYHGTMTYILMANKKWFEGLDPELQGFIIEAEKFGRVASRENYALQEQSYLDKVKNAPGVNYYELTAEEISLFREASKPVYDEHATSEWQKQFVRKLQEAFGR